jgi:hypothetical protein
MTTQNPQNEPKPAPQERMRDLRNPQSSFKVGL